MITFHTNLLDKKTLPGDVDLLRFSTPPGFSFTAGQYVVLTVPHEVLPVKRLYSIASPSIEPSYFELLIKRVAGGLASNYLQNLVVGQSLEFQGPAGQFSLKETPADKVFLSTGTGLAPVRSMLLSNPAHKQQFHLFWGLPNLGELYLFDELKTLALRDPLFSFSIHLSREQNLDAISKENQHYFSLGRINTGIDRLILSQPQNSLEYYICGRREMVESTREYLYSQHIDKERVFFERY